MTRKEFIEKSMIMGISLPFISSLLLESCATENAILPSFQTNFSGKVIVVGAGAAGLAAGYLLKRYGVDFEIIEAAPVYGGRLKKVENFADFPIDLGAEWIHTNPKVLTEIIKNPGINVDVDTIVYNPKIIKTWMNGKLIAFNYLSSFYSEWKFKNTTWYDFFEQFIVPEIADNIILNNPLTEINYEADKVILKSANNKTYEADKVLITTSIKILQNQQINFLPALPNEKLIAINKVFMGDGIKIFIEFKEKFYPDVLLFGNILQAFVEEEKSVYDAAFRKDSGKNILGLFAINEKASAYTKLNSDEEIINKFLGELDKMFDGKATPNYVKHIIQNWSNEPYIQGAYSYSFKGNKTSIVEALIKPVSDKLFFSGEALSIKNQAMVHGACESAYSVVAKMLSDK